LASTSWVLDAKGRGGSRANGLSDKGISNMTMLMNTYERRSRSSRGGDVVNTAAANGHGGMIRQFCLCALGALGAGAILAAIIGLETAFYLRALID
jgi:hypothetical protein